MKQILLSCVAALCYGQQLPNPVLDGIQRGMDMREQRARIEMYESMSKASRSVKRTAPPDFLDRIMPAQIQKASGVAKLQAEEREVLTTWLFDTVAAIQQALKQSNASEPQPSPQLRILNVLEGGKYVVSSDGTVWAVVEKHQSSVVEWKASAALRTLPDPDDSGAAMLLHVESGMLVRVKRLQ